MKNGGGGAPENKLLKGKFLGFTLELLRFKKPILPCYPEGGARSIYKNGVQEILHFVQHDMFCYLLSGTRGNKKEMLKLFQHDNYRKVILNLFQDLSRKSKKCHIDLSKQEGIIRQKRREFLSSASYAQNDKRCAFTLAEVLITLGVIGIVAAMTIPQLITSYKKKVTIERLKTTYSILSQAINMSKEKNGDIDTWDKSLSDIDFAKLYILPYIKTTGTITKKIEKNKYPNLYTLSSQSGMYSNCALWSDNLTYRPIYVMANGSWLVSKHTNSEMWITVDLNGQGGPNVMGIDGFSFILDPKTNQLAPYGYDKTRNQLLGKSYYVYACIRDNQWQYYRGGSCAALMMMDGWKMTKDYPWGNGGLTPLNK